MSDSSARWISTTEAAKLLGVNSRAVQKRAARGSIAARKVGNQWEIDVDAVDASNGRIADTTDATDASDVQGVDAMDASIGLNGRVHVDASGGAGTGEQVADLRDEVKFLRGVIEQMQRDHAETHAEHRAALKLLGAASVPQLTAGTPEPPGEPRRDLTANDSHEAKESAQRGTGARETAEFDYNALADEIERNLNQ